MKSIYVVCFYIIMGSFFSCKQDAATSQKDTSDTTTQENASEQAVNKENSSPAMSKEASGTQGKEASKGGHDYNFLTDKILIYKNAIGGAVGAEQPYKDEWIDLMPDGKYKAGKLKKQTHTGQWLYTHDTKTLFLRPDVTSYKMSEWTVKFNEDMLIWIGTSSYGDNALQLQLVRRDELP